MMQYAEASKGQAKNTIGLSFVYLWQSEYVII
jgi:hypothetical protein